MFILDDLLLAAVVAVFVLLVLTISPPLLCFLGLLIGNHTDSVTVGGVVKKKVTKELAAITGVENSINILLKSAKDENQVFNPVEYQVELYGYEKLSDHDMKIQTKRMNTAKDVYKREKGDLSIFDIDYEKMAGSYASTSVLKNNSSEYSNFTEEIINKLMHYRTLEEDYPTIATSAYLNWNMSNIEYTPVNVNEYNTTMEKIFEYAVVSSIRNLKDVESKELETLINKFQLGELTQSQMKLNFNDHTSQTIYNCNSYQIKKPYSDKYKKLHWGQRKLLLSEIDFFNRVALDIGRDKFKKDKISLVYPGSAHGHHLLIEMEMYPNLILYLWDPAMYNKVLYIADFLRRGMDVPYEYSEKHMEMAKKYNGRVFINMELTNTEFLKYWTNSTTGNIHKNFKPEYGFFTKKSADYFLKYKAKQKDTSPTLFVSDIRLFTKSEATNALMFNMVKDYNESIALRLINEVTRHADYVRDMQLQQDWMEYVKAEYGLFKFKLKTKNFSPKQSVQYKYVDGDIIFQAWAPIASTETRLFVKPVRKAMYYNVKKYTDKIKTFNLIMRTHDMSSVKLTDINIDVSGNSDATLEDIWSNFLDTSLIGQDAILESHILYDYLTIYKKKGDIKHTDLILMISDITQACLDPFDQGGILGYFDDVCVESVLNSRYKYHNSFSRRLDYNSIVADKFICKIKRPHELKKRKPWHNKK
jgi:hypothetical protein